MNWLTSTSDDARAYWFYFDTAAVIITVFACVALSLWILIPSALVLFALALWEVDSQ